MSKVYPWLLVATWGCWALLVAGNFAINFFDYEFITDQNQVYANNTFTPLSTWAGLSIAGTFCLAAFLAMPAMAVSVIGYFFCKPRHQR